MTVPLKYVVPNLLEALQKAEHPTITTWNRLEGRPRKDDFSRALKAEVRDATWMLARQWQVGEFHAEDAGSPIFAKVQVRASSLTEYSAAGGPREPFPGNRPLETTVERRPIAWYEGEQPMHLDLRAQVGRQWGKLLAAAGLDAYTAAYRVKFPFAVPPHDETGERVRAHRRAWQQVAALAKRAIDGGALLDALAGGAASTLIPGVSAGDKVALDGLGDELAAWFAQQYDQPADDGAWKPEYLEYQFECRAPQAGKGVVLEAEQYASGHIDWYAFDRVATHALDGQGGESVSVTPFIPTPIAFEGMPDARWWALEDRKTDFGAIKPTTTDLAQLLLMEFGLVYANDWFTIPCRVPAGTLLRVEGLAVTTNFGERFWITPAGGGTEDNWHRWSMYTLASPGAEVASTDLLIPPISTRILDGAPLEEVELARDEVANMVWAVERTIPSITGAGRPGKDEARETRSYHERLIADTDPPPPDYAAAIWYLAMTTVPEHWIPFVPVHVPGSVREIQLQRGRIPRAIEGGPQPPPTVPPRTTLVRTGLDADESYFVHEEEVPRSGALLTRAFRRTRWIDGGAPVWIGHRKQTGRGGRGSGLAFDSIETRRDPK